MHWRVTGDTGTVVKLGQCQTLQPWLSLFLSANTFFHTLTPFLSSSTRSFSISPSFMHPLSPLHFPMSQLCSVPLCFSVMTRKQTLNNYRYIKNQCQCHDRRETYRGRSSFETSYWSHQLGDYWQKILMKSKKEKEIKNAMQNVWHKCFTVNYNGIAEHLNYLPCPYLWPFSTLVTCITNYLQKHQAEACNFTETVCSFITVSQFARKAELRSVFHSFHNSSKAFPFHRGFFDYKKHQVVNNNCRKFCVAQHLAKSAILSIKNHQ